MPISARQPQKALLCVSTLLALWLCIFPAANGQPGLSAGSADQREVTFIREKVGGLLDTVFGRSAYHLEVSTRGKGHRIVLVVDSRFRGDYTEAELRTLLGSVAELDFGGADDLILSSLPMAHGRETPTDESSPSTPLLLLLGALLLSGGGAVGWLLARRPLNPYRDQLDAQLESLHKLAEEDPSRVAQVLRLWMRPAAATSAESGGMTQRELAAVIVLSLPKATAASVLRQLLPRELQTLGDIMVRIARVRRTVLRYAVKQFFDDVQEATGFGVKSEADYRSLLESALGEQRAQLIAGAPELQAHIPLLENLRWLEADTIAEMISGEHPQIQAIVVASLDTEKATRTLENLPEQGRADVLLRVAEIDKLQPAAAEAVSRLIESRLESMVNQPNRTPPGQRQAAAILKSVTADWSEVLLQEVYQRDHRLAALLQEQMFTMDDLLGLTSSDWQKVEQQLPDELLARALLSCRPDTREGFLQRLPRGRARSLRPLLKQYAGLGAELIQQSANDVLLMVRRMAASGDIVLSGELRLASPATAGEV
ncbi:FliG C-terminal domain-containing protein [Litorivivens sp.]|uniref:FliG C-terminal domain-containing protein n=1 Tax=Litorivivens sp. TaxID=2020868 RepID=UPI0035662DC8